jgi:hypothetical protein
MVFFVLFELHTFVPENNRDKFIEVFHLEADLTPSLLRRGAGVRSRRRFTSAYCFGRIPIGMRMHKSADFHRLAKTRGAINFSYSINLSLIHVGYEKIPIFLHVTTLVRRW